MIIAFGKMTQLPLEDWPENLNDLVATIDLEPEELEARCGISFGESYDSLDWFKGAVFSNEGVMFSLIRYRGSPVGGTDIVVESGYFKPELGIGQLGEILICLKITPKNVTWVKGGN